MSDSFNAAFRLHSHAPNSTINYSAPPKIPTVSSITTSSQPYCICAHCTHLFTFNHHPGRSQSQQSSRWSPTPAQLLFLEEMYRRGTKTPTAEQIHQIASQLRRFGKIEAKNVFYWFQNHKARERQKRRRSETEITITASSGQQKQPYLMGISSENQLQQEPHQGLKGTGNEVKETKKWASPSNCSRHAEESASLDIAERQAHYWTKFEERELQVLTTTCQNKKMPCFPCSPIKDLTSHTHTQANSNPLNYDDEETADSRTLELFPHKRDEQDYGVCITESEDDICANANSISMDSEITSSQYFEFLPVRHH